MVVPDETAKAKPQRDGKAKGKITGQKSASGALSEKEERFVSSLLAPILGEQAHYQAWVDVALSSGSRTADPQKQKWNKRIVVVGSFRIYLISKGLRGLSVDSSPHIYDVAVVGGLDGSLDAKAAGASKKSKKPVYSGEHILRLQISLERSTGSVDGASDDAKQKLWLIYSTQHADNILHALRMSYARVSAHFGERDFVHPFTMLVNVPTERVRASTLDPSETEGAAGLNSTYVAMCNYRGERVGFGFPRFVEEQYRRGTRVMQLNLCPGIEQRSEVALATGSVLQALNFDPYFRAIIMRRVTLDKGPGLEPGLCMRYNSNITKLVFTGIDGPIDWVNLGRALHKNKQNQLQILDVSDNMLTAKDVSALATAIEHLEHALPVLRMSGCHLKAKSVQDLMETFKENYRVSLSIRELDLSRNEFGAEGTSALSSWLQHAREFSQLQRLILNDAAIEIGLMEDACLGQLLGLDLLDLGGNNFGQNGIAVLASAFSSARFLRRVKLDGCRGLDGLGVTSLMRAALENTELHDIEMNFAGTPALGKDGPSAAEAISFPLRDLAEKKYSLKSLNFTNCRLSAVGVSALLSTLGEHCMTLAELSVGGNINDPKDEFECHTFAQALVRFFEGGTGVTKLSIEASSSAAVGPSLEVFFRYLSRDQGLEVLDFTGNACGDRAFLTLTESLCVNLKLHTLKIDNNQLGYNSFLALRQVLERNVVLRDIAHPSHDLGVIRDKYRKTPRILELRDTVFAFESKLAKNLAEYELLTVSVDDFADEIYDPNQDDSEADEALRTMRLYASWWPKGADRDDAEPPAVAAPLEILPAHLVDGVPLASRTRRPMSKRSGTQRFLDLELGTDDDDSGSGAFELDESAQAKRSRSKTGKARSNGDKKSHGKRGKKAITNRDGDQATVSQSKEDGNQLHSSTEADVAGDEERKRPTTKHHRARGKTSSRSRTDGESASQVDQALIAPDRAERERQIAEREAELAEKERRLQEKITRRETMRDLRKGRSKEQAKQASESAVEPETMDDTGPPPNREAPKRTVPQAPDSADSVDSADAKLDELIHAADDIPAVSHLEYELSGSSESSDDDLPPTAPEWPSGGDGSNSSTPYVSEDNS